MSKEWLKSLPLGAIILAPYQGYVEELKVVRTVKPNNRITSVLIKRPHLQQCLPMTEDGDKYVGFQFSAKVGKTFHEFAKWKVIFPASE